MQTRTITNSGHPLQDMTGSLLATTPVYFELVDGCSNPAGSFASTGEYIAPVRGIATTDAGGIFSITLPCTDGMSDPRYYLCTVDHPDCPVFMAPITYSAVPLPWADFKSGGQAIPAAVVDPFTRHMQDTAIHTPAGSTHNHLITITAAEALGGHRVATVGGVYADSSNPAHAYAIAGITLQAVASGATLDAQYIGELTESSWDWTPDEPVFLGSNGMLTQTAPDVGFILQIGIPTTSTTLLIAIQPPLIIA